MTTANRHLQIREGIISILSKGERASKTDCRKRNGGYVVDNLSHIYLRRTFVLSAKLEGVLVHLKQLIATYVSLQGDVLHDSENTVIQIDDPVEIVVGLLTDSEDVFEGKRFPGTTDLSVVWVVNFTLAGVFLDLDF
jgi:hypothetical protein